MTRADVERFFRVDLLPRLLPGHARVRGSVLVLDNASIHKGGNIERLARRAGCRVLYLPPYSPDLNPIELIWSFVKRQVRREGLGGSGSCCGDSGVGDRLFPTLWILSINSGRAIAPRPSARLVNL